MSLIKKNKLRSTLAALLVSGLVAVIYFAGFNVGAQSAKAQRMRCTPVELSGAVMYDVLKKKMGRPLRKVFVNRCVSAEAVCYHSFDQAGHLSCVSK